MLGAGPVGVEIDLNADVGEGFPDDERLLGVVTSANVACGFHAGSAESMRVTCATAAGRSVAVGAHPSYRDRDGFGRRAFDVSPQALREDVAEQVGALVGIAAEEGVAVVYLKPHGALYTRAIDDDEVAGAIVSVACDHALAVLAWPRSELLVQARTCGLEAVAEGFADRGYADGRLVPRDAPGALLGADEAAAQAVTLARAGEVGSICVHGDTPGAADLAAQVRAALTEAGASMHRFA
jgi:5-oxoprolinase (ATP-hydrolysing) subunit A